MMNTYILTGKRLNGHIEVKYLDGVLNDVSASLQEPLNVAQFEAFRKHIPMLETGLGELKMIGLHCQRTAAPNEKIQLFCAKYEQHKGIKYKTTAAEAGKVKLIKFTAEELDKYLTSENFLFKGKQSISNLVRYYNEFRAEVNAKSKSKYPDHYSKAFQDKLNNDELPEYWAHLRSLGLSPKKDRVGNVIDWIKNN